MSLFIPSYFGPISEYSEILKNETIVFEMEDNFQKQSYRNRCYIFNSSGKQLLNIPVKNKNKGTTQRKKTKDLLVDNDALWQEHHLKSLQTAYRTSPFYEYYEDDLLSIFKKNYTFLQDVNIDTFLFVTDALQISQKYSITEEYIVNVTENDFRALSDIKNKDIIIFITPSNDFKDLQNELKNKMLLKYLNIQNYKQNLILKF